MSDALDDVPAKFRRFAERECRGSSPLYETLALATADDPELSTIARAAPKGQPIPNLFLASVHFLLLGGADEELAAFYASLTDQPRPADEAFPRFRSFCVRHRDAIEHLLRTRTVQTNEVGRCAYLYPAFALVAELSGRPLAIVELGASAGLNLLWDQYRYEYDGQTFGQRAGGILIRSTFRDTHRPSLPPRAPLVVDRVGIDLAPVDVGDEDQIAWLRALVWPEHRERAALLASAVAFAQKNPPRVIRGDALASLPAVLREVPDAAAVCITHTHTLNQMSHGARVALSDFLDHAGRHRPLYRVSAEWLTTTYPALELTSWAGDAVRHRRLASCDPHGGWIEWLDEAGYRPSGGPPDVPPSRRD